MDNLTQLIIRACKRGNTFTRLKSIYRRFYLAQDITDEEAYEWVCGILLAPVVDHYNPITTSNLLAAIRKEKEFSMYFPVEDRITDENQIVFDVLTSRIRYTEKSKLEGLKQPLWHKNKFGANV